MHCCSVRSCSSHRRPSVSSAPSRFLDSSGVFFSAFFFPHSTLFESFLGRPTRLASSSEPKSLCVRYPTLHEAVVKSSLATNLSRRQALFVQGNYCSSVFWWSARHAFLSKKIEKSSTYHRHKVLCVVCGVCLIF